SETGSIYVHCDWRIEHYIKPILDEILGSDNFRNAISWHYSGWNKQLKSHFERRHDSILFYSKTDTATFNSYSEPYTSVEEYLATRKQELHTDPDGRQYTLDVREGGKRQTKIYLDDALRR